MIDPNIPLQYRGFDAGQAVAGIKQMKLADLAAEQRQQQIDMQGKQFEAQQAEAQRTAQQAQAERLSRLANVANEQNWGNVRQAAIGLGVDPSMIPEAFDPAFVERQKAAFAILNDPQEADKIDRDLKRAGYIEGTPEYIEAARAILFQPRVVADAYGGANVIPTEPGALQAYMGGNRAPQPSGIPQQAIDALRNGEGSPEQFDAVFGPGSAAKVMGGSGGNVGGGFPGN